MPGTAMLKRAAHDMLTMWRVLALILVVSFGAGAQSATQIAISSPASGDTVHDNEGNVAVTVVAQGAGEGHTIRLLLDGAPYGSNQRVPWFRLENIDRGEHTLQAQLINEDNRVIAESRPVTFYMWRASALFKGRRR